MRIFLWIFFCFPLIAFGQSKKPASDAVNSKMGHSISITMKPYQNTKIYIGTNYGKNKVLADSCLLNEKSEGVFESKQKLSCSQSFQQSSTTSVRTSSTRFAI